MNSYKESAFCGEEEGLGGWGVGLWGTAFVEETLCSDKEASCEDNNGRRPIARLNILSSRKIDQLPLTPIDGHRATTILAAGCRTAICFRIVAPSLVMMVVLSV
jgi:hypothetical protein